MSRTADVVIVGGGVTGTSIAFHLAGRGARNVLLLERNALASGGTGLSVGIVRQLYPTPETTQMVLRSLSVFRQFGDAVGGHSGYVGCGVLIGVSPAMRPQLEQTLALLGSNTYTGATNVTAGTLLLSNNSLPKCVPSFFTPGRATRNMPGATMTCGR